jgi:hypothetical protein
MGERTKRGMGLGGGRLVVKMKAARQGYYGLRGLASESAR